MMCRGQPSPLEPYTALRYTQKVDNSPEITVLQLPNFKAEATELIGSAGIEAVAVYLIDHRDAVDVMPDSGGTRKLRWAAKGKGKCERKRLSGRQPLERTSSRE